MSSYALAMREETSSWASAFLQFETGRGREGYRSYAFVEDDDDKAVYQVALSAYDHICYLGCGGKTGVVSVFRKLSKSNESAGNLFFVDRDTELEPFEFGDEVLRTASYSWESHVCEPDFVGWFLQRRMSPNLTVKEKHDAETSWKNSVDAFRRVLAKHTALCLTARLLDQSLGMRNVVFWQDASWSGNGLLPGPASLDWYPDKANLAVEKGAALKDIEEREAELLNGEAFSTARGKALFATLRVFCQRLEAALQKRLQGQWNSARAWVEAMPWTDNRLQYIRDYAVARIGPP